MLKLLILFSISVYFRKKKKYNRLILHNQQQFSIMYILNGSPLNFFASDLFFPLNAITTRWFLVEKSQGRGSRNKNLKTYDGSVILDITTYFYNPCANTKHLCSLIFIFSSFTIFWITKISGNKFIIIFGPWVWSIYVVSV